MKEPTSRTWITGCAFTFALSLLIDHLMGAQFTLREVFKTLSYSMLIVTAGWLFALARWHRGILKG